METGLNLRKFAYTIFGVANTVSDISFYTKEVNAVED